MGSRILPKVGTSQRSAQFYVSWFNRCYRVTDSGWVISHTPDGHAIMHQDAFFWRALEIVCGAMNEKLREDMSKGGK